MHFYHMHHSPSFQQLDSVLCNLFHDIISFSFEPRPFTGNSAPARIL
jgi:hypothetical protein